MKRFLEDRRIRVLLLLVVLLGAVDLGLTARVTASDPENTLASVNGNCYPIMGMNRYVVTAPTDVELDIDESCTVTSVEVFVKDENSGGVFTSRGTCNVYGSWPNIAYHFAKQVVPRTMTPYGVEVYTVAHTSCGDYTSATYHVTLFPGC